jgi:hypothetical protein
MLTQTRDTIHCQVFFGYNVTIGLSFFAHVKNLIDKVI